MDTKTLAVPTMAQDIERVLIDGDLSQLTPEQRVSYYRSVCDSLGMNPLTRPFDYLRLQGKLTLYAKREACDQIRDKKHISIDKPDIRFEDGLVIVTVTAHDRNGRTDSEIAALPVENLRGTDRANAIMKAVTKGKRRVTLSICGLGVITEDDVDEIPNAHQAEVRDNGEIVIHKPEGEWTEGLDEGVPTGTHAPPPGYVAPAEKVHVPSHENGNTEKPARPYSLDLLRRAIATRAEKTYQGHKVSPGHRGQIIGALDALFGGSADKRHEFLFAVTGHKSSKDIADNYMESLWDWVNGDLATIKAEAERALSESLKEQGQTELPQT